MTLQELRYLVALADHRHFGRAAETCHVTQPTLSNQLRKLEGYLGLTLIDRTGKQPELTLSGELVVEHARRLLAEARSILSLTTQRHGPLEGVLHLGLIPTLAPYYLPWLLPILKSNYPRLRVVINEDMTRYLLEKLDEQQIDAVFLALPVPVTHPAYVEWPLFEEPFYVACASGHEIEKSTHVDAQTLAELRLLLLTDGHCLRGQALAACGQQESSQTDGADVRATSLETLRQLVAAGLGCTLLPALARDRLGGNDLVTRPLASGQSRRIGLVWRAGHVRDADLRLMASELQAAVQPGVHPTR